MDPSSFGDKGRNVRAPLVGKSAMSSFMMGFAVWSLPLHWQHSRCESSEQVHCPLRGSVVPAKFSASGIHGSVLPGGEIITAGAKPLPWKYCSCRRPTSSQTVTSSLLASHASVTRKWCSSQVSGQRIPRHLVSEQHGTRRSHQRDAGIRKNLYAIVTLSSGTNKFQEFCAHDEE